MEKVQILVDSRIRAGKMSGVQVGIIVRKNGEILGTGMFLHRKCHDPKTGEAYSVLKAIELAHAQEFQSVELVISSLEKFPTIAAPSTPTERYHWCAADLAKSKKIKVSFSKPTEKGLVDKMLDKWRGPVGYRETK